MRVEIFSSRDVITLQECVNRFLAEQDYYGVLDIKFTESSETYSAMILYMAKKTDE